MELCCIKLKGIPNNFCTLVGLTKGKDRFVVLSRSQFDCSNYNHHHHPINSFIL